MFRARLRAPLYFRLSSSRSASTVSSYVASLRAKYPAADAPSLIAAFLVLHELTALVPLVLAFGGLKSLGVGETAVDWFLEDRPGREGHESWLKRGARRWIAQGEESAERIGRRYGVLGFEKETRDQREHRKRAAVVDGPTVRQPYSVGGDVANLAVAYVGVKLLLPFRLVFSARLAPVLANVVGARLRGIGARYLKK